MRQLAGNKHDWCIRVGDILSLSANWGEGRGEVIPRSGDEIRVVRVNRVRHRREVYR